MSCIKDTYKVMYNGSTVGYYYTFSDGTSEYSATHGCSCDIEEELKARGLDVSRRSRGRMRIFSNIIKEKNRVPGRKRMIFRDGAVSIEREPRETGERYSVYRRSAEQGEPDYSPLPHDAPHYEGAKTPEGMREWASWYAFNKMDDGTYEAELDEAWWWGGGHNDGGTIHREIPEEWFGLSYDEFLENVVCLAAASHYGFTAEMLKAKKGLKEFFGFGE